MVCGNRAWERFLNAKLAQAAGTAYLLLYVSENQPAANRVDKGLAVGQLEVIQTKSMDRGLVTVDAAAFRRRLSRVAASHATESSLTPAPPSSRQSPKGLLTRLAGC